jgi:ankyrin repeat protein
LLLGHGADASIRDKQGKTALAWAEAQGYSEMAQALKDATGKK